MVKKVLCVVLGFVMIMGGVWGVTTTMVEEKNREVVNQVEKIRQQAEVSVSEGQKTMDEKVQRVETLAANLEKERQRLEEIQRKQEESRRSQIMAMETERKSEVRSDALSSPGRVKNKGDVSRKKQTAQSRKQRGSNKVAASSKSPVRNAGPKVARQEMKDKRIQWISQKAGVEAARELGPVEYVNHKTQERLLAEPVDHIPSSVRVRLRVWKRDRLVKDEVFDVPVGVIRPPRGTRA